MMAQLLCSDLDGTLVDTRAANHEAYAAALAEHGVSFTWEEFIPTWGKDSREFLRDVAPALTEAERDAVRARKAMLYPSYFSATTLNHGLVEMLRLARAAGTRTALVTTSKAESARAILHHHGIDDLFDHAVFGDDVRASKPDAEPYQRALAAAAVPAHRAITFEDSPSGMASAAAAGITAVRVVFP